VFHSVTVCVMSHESWCGVEIREQCYDREDARRMKEDGLITGVFLLKHNKRKQEYSE